MVVNLSLLKAASRSTVTPPQLSNDLTAYLDRRVSTPSFSLIAKSSSCHSSAPRIVELTTGQEFTQKHH